MWVRRLLSQLSLTRFERFREAVAPRHVFLGRILISAAAALVLTAIFVVTGAIFYYWIFFHENCSGRCWIEAFHRASMILSGMGPAGGEPRTDGERIFVDVYALISSLVLAGALGIILAPFFHRVMHHFHLPDEKDEPSKETRPNREKPRQGER
jgi:hypothetical protein